MVAILKKLILWEEKYFGLITVLNKSKIIKFARTHVNMGNEAEPPISSKRIIPEWYKKIDSFRDFYQDGEERPTIKRCIPVLDSMMLGYVLTLPEDVVYDEETNLFDSSDLFHDTHNFFQIDGYPIDENFHKIAYKWNNFFHIETPKGYSLLFTHPFHRMDLPFQTMTGLVDSDVYPLTVLFPFLMKKGFSGTIKAGTPIVQIIPIKRDDWSLKEIKNKIEFLDERLYFKDNQLGAYKRSTRQNKNFKDMENNK